MLGRALILRGPAISLIISRGIQLCPCESLVNLQRGPSYLYTIAAQPLNGRLFHSV